jgi:hypothetical protein
MKARLPLQLRSELRLRLRSFFLKRSGRPRNILFHEHLQTGRGFLLQPLRRAAYRFSRRLRGAATSSLQILVPLGQSFRSRAIERFAQPGRSALDLGADFAQRVVGNLA